MPSSSTQNIEELAKQARAGVRASSLARCLQSSELQFVTAAASINGKVGRLL